MKNILKSFHELAGEIAISNSIEKISTNSLLSAIASILFSIPASSVSSERLFSKSGLIYGNKLRNRLSEKRAEDCLLIKAQLPRKFEEDKDHTLLQNVFLSDDESQEE